MSMISKLCVLLAVLMAGPAARAALIIQIDDLASGGGNPFFNYDFDLATPGIQGIAQTGGDFTGTVDFSQFIFQPPPDPSGLLLGNDAIEITFNLPAGWYVLSLDLNGQGFTDPLSATVTYAGRDNANNPVISPTENYGPGLFTSTSTAYIFSQLDSVTITGIETLLFNVSAVVAIPEPSTIWLAGGAVGLLLARRRTSRPSFRR